MGVRQLPKVNPPRFRRALGFETYPLRVSFASILCKFLSVFFMLFAGLKIGCIGSALPYFSSSF